MMRLPRRPLTQRRRQVTDRGLQGLLHVCPPRRSPLYPSRVSPGGAVLKKHGFQLERRRRAVKVAPHGDFLPSGYRLRGQRLGSRVVQLPTLGTRRARLGGREREIIGQGKGDHRDRSAVPDGQRAAARGRHRYGRRRLSPRQRQPDERTHGKNSDVSVHGDPFPLSSPAAGSSSFLTVHSSKTPRSSSCRNTRNKAFPVSARNNCYSSGIGKWRTAP